MGITDSCQYNALVEIDTIICDIAMCISLGVVFLLRAINSQQEPRGCGCKQHFGMFPVTEVLAKVFPLLLECAFLPSSIITDI